MNARANMPSCFKKRAKLSVNLRSGAFAGGCSGSGSGAGLTGCFLGDDERKKLSMPPFDGGEIGRGATTTGAGMGGGGARALNCAMMCGSRRTLMVKVNSSLVCSILFAHNEPRWSASRETNPRRVYAQLKLLLNAALRREAAFRGSHEVDTVIQCARNNCGLARDGPLYSLQPPN